jgi:MoxR-like ATPase
MNPFDLIGALDEVKGTAEAEQTKVLATRAERLVPFTRPAKEYARDYIAGEELKTAVNVALSLGRPLLLTGEPGSGKTLAAQWIALRLGLEKTNYLEFQVRSDSRARDLRYDFDAASWYRMSQLAGSPLSKKKFIRPRALGIAFGWNEAEDSKPYVVLIDEIDKAPRDFPNDLLLELDQMLFDVEETGARIGPPAHRPIIVITSNSERRLPDPFLRRCIIHNIEMTEKTVMDILRNRLVGFGAQDDLIKSATSFWTSLVGLGLGRKPTIAEFWQWLALESQYGGRRPAELAQVLTNRGPRLRELKYIATLFSAADVERLVGKP